MLYTNYTTKKCIRTNHSHIEETVLYTGQDRELLSYESTKTDPAVQHVYTITSLYTIIAGTSGSHLLDSSSNPAAHTAAG